MKNRVKALLLAGCLTVSMLSIGAYAQEASQNASTEETILETEEAAAEEAAVEETAEVSVQGSYENLQERTVEFLHSVTGKTMEDLEADVASGDSEKKIVAVNWATVMEDLGTLTECTYNEEASSQEEKTSILVYDCEYDGVDKDTTVSVTAVYTNIFGDIRLTDMNWNVTRPMSQLMGEAALNTVMGVGIVFAVLLFLSLLISQLHWIPDIIDKRKAQNTPPAPAPVAVSEPEPEYEEDVTDDEELVAVIAAAIAAAEEKPVDGFVVRSIKKAGRRSWA